jgi:hypothetical protein
MAVGNFDGHNSEVAVLGSTTISVLLNNGSAAPTLPGAAFAKGAVQIVGTGLTSNGTRQAFPLGAPQALRAPNVAVERAPEHTAATLPMQDQLNALPWLSKTRKIKWAVRTRSISSSPN